MVTKKKTKKVKATDIMAAAATRSTGLDLESTIRRAEIALLHTPEGGVINFEDMLHRSAFGILNKKQREVIAPFVEGKRVFDLGAGELFFSKELIKMGASHVIAIDKALPKQRLTAKNITLCPVYFDQYRASNQEMPKRADVVFVSWPSNRPMPGFLDFTAMAGTVIYLGKNTDGNCCAWPEFFIQCQLRKVLAYVPDRPNDLIVYGGALEEGDERKMLLEEWAGIDHSKQYNTGDAVPISKG